MRTVHIVRDQSGPSGVFGTLLTDSGYGAYTLEPAVDRAEHPCIPEGCYRAELRPHPKHGVCYELVDVPGRTSILIHWGNFQRDTEGCILVGNAIGEIGNEPAILQSKDAYSRFMSDMATEGFYLHILWRNTKSTV